MKTLHLNLKKTYFDMILSGLKLEEYRSITEYWLRRLIQFDRETEWGVIEEFLQDIQNPYQNHSSFEELFEYFQCRFRDFDTITFSNGYSKDRREFVIEFKGIAIGKGKTEWGAEENELYFVIKLGSILSTKNTICQNLENASVSM